MQKYRFQSEAGTSKIIDRIFNTVPLIRVLQKMRHVHIRKMGVMCRVYTTRAGPDRIGLVDFSITFSNVSQYFCFQTSYDGALPRTIVSSLWRNTGFRLWSAGRRTVELTLNCISKREWVPTNRVLLKSAISRTTVHFMVPYLISVFVAQQGILTFWDRAVIITPSNKMPPHTKPRADARGG